MSAADHRPGATGYAERVVTGHAGTFNWSDLEAHAFAGYPSVHAALAAAGAEFAPGAARVEHSRSIGMLLLMLAPLLLPLVVILGGRFEEPERGSTA